ncbi:MAG TPA: bifunctional 2-C-methyl-D-erythritol 4-phosphate cytidylyltransferase/2-C-methyl-D-erythritol 2,4-cyclodiphosphate synthase [Rhizomicrobium sp.]|jgi:2-C-methyl-D-erythritol 4-phosphate cytidylyltransferase / 2-C-methyl-D-erythritol 2,4-cyclodiphosphate synthase|nr:bifunctional 2-C-methyl-D-erythritol 4-phosphate cytidylyltransferase/2-C-methyl-D-erythritol 2,4-cyclodiphosphate synthase [Rhizomicrobium sp.]
MFRTAILIVAAGKGERSGRTGPKQFELLAGKPMLRRSMEAFAGWPVRVVIGPGQEQLYCDTMGPAAPPPIIGGARRQDSVRLGLEEMAKDAPDYVLIHDAARPLVSRATIEAVIGALEKGADGAVPMVAVADTLRRKEGNAWVTVPREGLERAQTPQGFRFAAILKAHRNHAGAEATDDAAIAGLAGLAVEAVKGEETNLKVTTEKDFALAERLLGGETRSAMGYDAHRFTAGDHVWLCGVKVPHDHGLEGHSDADAGLHALTDAVLGTIGAGDIGQHFPPTDERWRGAPSWKFLDHAAKLVTAKGGEILHCDVTLICERPKIGPHRDAMRARIAEILSLAIDRVSVKATTTEGMGYTGRREGLAAQAIATIRLPS